MRTAGPWDKLDNERREHCKKYSAFSDKCRQCAMHGAYRFCKEFDSTQGPLPKGGLF